MNASAGAVTGMVLGQMTQDIPFVDIAIHGDSSGPMSAFTTVSRTRLLVYIESWSQLTLGLFWYTSGVLTVRSALAYPCLLGLLADRPCRHEERAHVDLAVVQDADRHHRERLRGPDASGRARHAESSVSQREWGRARVNGRVNLRCMFSFHFPGLPAVPRLDRQGLRRPSAGLQRLELDRLLRVQRRLCVSVASGSLRLA